jgi:hypothetical protein
MTIDRKRYEGHTPGPWIVSSDEALRVREQQFGGTVAKVNMLKGKHGMGGLLLPSEVHANARLIADAPLLLAELDRLNKWADGFSDAQLKERATGEAYQRELRDKLDRQQRQVDRLAAALRELVDAHEAYRPQGKSTHDELAAMNIRVTRAWEAARAALEGLSNG